MKRQWMLLGMLTLVLAALLVSPSQANFVQCPGGAGPIVLTPCGGPQGTTDEADLINGSDDADDIAARDGDDVIFGNGGNDDIGGGGGRDFIFGGLGSDDIFGGPDGDVMLGGPDDFSRVQRVAGADDNDTINVMVGETVNCLVLADNGGLDTANLIGFGPYTLDKPYGLQPGFGNGWLMFVDPIAGGEIYIRVQEDDDGGIERINGLLSPNVSFVAGPQNALPVNCRSLV